MINSLHNKIATVVEPAFRNFLIKNYFHGKSVKERKEFIDQKSWFKKLYPICEIEKYKVVFLTTSRYFSPINTFYRLPFNIYSDGIISDSLTIIDEFDASKSYILSQIIDNGLETNTNIVQMFVDVYYILKNLHFPELLSKVTKYNKEKVESGEWKSAKEMLRLNQRLFTKVYQELNLDLLLKTDSFKTKKVFIFNDGGSINIFNDRSNRHLYLRADRNERLLKINSSSCQLNRLSVNDMLGKINRCLRSFAKAVLYISRNYRYFKNSITDNQNENQYTLEESMATIMSIFNLSTESRQYLKKLAILNENTIPENVKKNIRKGFKFTEIEDSNYHDLQSLIHQFDFETTPENLLVEIASAAKLIGVSATATFPTVIGNFDLDYLKTILNQSYHEVATEDKVRIKQTFLTKQNNMYDQTSIHPIILDASDRYSNKEKSRGILQKIYSEDKLAKYLSILDGAQTNQFYFSIYCKITYMYYLIIKNNIKSTIAFLNRLPKYNDSKLDINFLQEMFRDIEQNNCFPPINVFYIKSDDFEGQMSEVYQKLTTGESCLVITTYQTVGSGKNLQYDICDCDLDRIIEYNRERWQKDFEAIYLETPRNLVTNLTYESENKYRDLAQFLFEQRSLSLAKKIHPNRYYTNIVNGFRKIFFNDSYAPTSNKNIDINYHTAQIVVQAIGRICRCDNKNKNIYIFCEQEILRRLKRIDFILENRLFNKEFLSLYTLKQDKSLVENVSDLAKINSDAANTIKMHAYTVRNSWQKVYEWQALRDYVLRNPTVSKESLFEKYNDLYFTLDDTINSYSYENGRNNTLKEFYLLTNDDMPQVSAVDSELPIMLNIDCVFELFKKNMYAKTWHYNQCIMTPALYKQIYKGALGEVVGKEIIENQIGWELSNIEDYSKYELFDYVIKEKQVYFDFKHWNNFVKDTSSAVEKIKNKLNRVKGEKAIIVNIIKRGEHIAHQNIDGNILQIPYLIDEKTNEISTEMINIIQEFI